MARLFGTDGVRGIAGSQLDALLAYRLGRAGATVLSRHTDRRPRILVGRDTRISGHMLSCALNAGICSVGADVWSVAMMPTPAIAYLVRKYGCDAGVMISASHNPMEFNGIKFFAGDGLKLPDEVEDQIEALVHNGENLPTATHERVGYLEHITGAREDYIHFLKQSMPVDMTGMRIALDCANGAASAIAPALFEQLGAEVFPIHDQPNGLNINLQCGSTHMESLCAHTRRVNADLGIAFDGDADRMLAVDDTGEVVDGDRIMLLCAADMKACGELAKDTLVVTVMSNMGLHVAARELGIQVQTTAVGDRYVLERMLQHGYSIGGEQSGHVIQLPMNTTGDGLLSALRLISTMRRSGRPLSALKHIMQVYPQVIINVSMQNQEDGQRILHDETICRRVAQIEQAYQGNGRVLLRASGTEPLMRVMIEGPDQTQVQADAQALADLIRRRS